MAIAEKVHHAVAPYAAGGIDAVRTDGGLVHIRPVQPEDIGALLELHEGVSERSRYLRFFSFSRTSAVAYVRLLVRPATERHVALCAWIDGRLVGVAAYERISDTAAELALLVTDAHHHQGIGTLLVEHLAAAARRVGIARVRRRCARRERHGRARAARPGLPRRAAVGGSHRADRASTSPPMNARCRRSDDPEQAAGAASLQPILSPASVAVIGAGERPDSVGHQVLRNILVRRLHRRPCPR